MAPEQKNAVPGEVKAPAMSSEQAADLAMLESGAAAQEAALNPQAAPAEEKPKPKLADEIAGLMATAIATLSPVLPSLATIYTDSSIGAASAAIAGVCEKHGWLEGGMFGEYGAEISAAFVLIPLAIATNQGVRHDIAAAKAKVEGQQKIGVTAQVNQAGVDQKSVIIGQPVVYPA